MKKFNKEFDEHITLDEIREKIKSDYVKKLHQTETKMFEQMLFNKYQFAKFEAIDYYIIGSDALNIYKNNLKTFTHLSENDIINIAFNFKSKYEI